MSDFDADVCVVGCGPVGAAAAILFARAGLRVRVLDRSTEVYDLPRGVLLDGETVRAFQRIGLGDEVAGLLQPWRDGDAAVFTDSRHEPLFGIDMPPSGSNGWRDGAFFDQPELEGWLRRTMAAEPKVDARFGHEVTGLAQDGAGVTVRATELATGRNTSTRARYVVACDGASSFVRRHLGIAWRSLGYDRDWLVVDVEVGDTAKLPPVTMQICDPARLTTYICGKDPFRRWEFRLLPGETRDAMAEPGNVRRLLAPWIDASDYELRRSVVYQFHAATAERWREGRVFLAGDAAHQTPPFLGQGMNAGFRDVVNLSWKLALVLGGKAPEHLLDSYEAERDGHAHELVDWAVAVGRLMDAMAEQEAGTATGPPPDDLLRSGYGQGRTAPPIRGGLVVGEQVSDAGVTGYLFSQPTVRPKICSSEDGGAVRLDEILGPGFAVVARDDASLSMSDASRSILAGLGATFTSLAGLEAVEGSFDRLFGSHAAAVVRPDRYVFGVTDASTTLDEIVRRLDVLWQNGVAPGERR
jgi:3-(3-hydroxy-phenyl)propionate hydroxylase